MSFEKIAKDTYRKFDNTLTIHVTNSPLDLDWENTPRDLLISIAKNKYIYKSKTKRSIGHVTVEINYTAQDGTKVHRFGGQGVKDLSQFAKKLIKQGYGFSIILGPEQLKQYEELSKKPMVQIDGRFESAQELIEELDFNIYKNDLNAFVTYQLNADTCKKLVEYFDEYEKQSELAANNPAHPNRAATSYGFGADPLKFEGAGCATFVEAFYKLAGLGQHYKNFYQTVNIPAHYFGDPKSGHTVNLFKLLFSKLKLNQPKEQHLNIEFPSPGEMFNQMKKAFQTLDAYDGLKILEKGEFGDSKAFYLVFDAAKNLEN